MMRKYLIPAAIAAVVVSAPAAAKDGMMYVGADFGVLMPRNVEVDIIDVDTGTSINNAFDIQYNTGFDIDGQIGYDFGGFKLEGEVGFKHAGFDAVSFSPQWIDFLEDELGAVVDPADIEIEEGTDIINVMANGLVDIGPDDGFGGYVGGGLGFGFAKAYGESDESFAWQLIAGLRFPVSENVDLGLRYKYFHMSTIDFNPGVDVDGTIFNVNLDGSFRSHSVGMNATAHF